MGSERLISLAIEYRQIVNMMRSGAYDGAEYQHLSAQRTLVHDELLREIGLTRQNTNMYHWCGELLWNLDMKERIVSLRGDTIITTD